MEGGTISGAQATQSVNNTQAIEGWEEGLNGVESATKVQPTQNTTSIVDQKGQFTPEVEKVLSDMIGNMSIEMVKKQGSDMFSKMQERAQE